MRSFFLIYLVTKGSPLRSVLLPTGPQAARSGPPTPKAGAERGGDLCDTGSMGDMGILPFGAFCLAVRTNFLPTNGFSTKPLKVKVLAGEQNATSGGFL